VGFPAALVAQDGFCQQIVDWEAFDVLFVGGTTEFKMSAAAEMAITLAKLADKPVHVGRVNSQKRYDHFKKLGVESVDGTFVKFGPDINIPKLLKWVE